MGSRIDRQQADQRLILDTGLSCYRCPQTLGRVQEFEKFERHRLAAMPQTLKGTVKIEISAGELIDKLTILQIRAERTGDPDKLAKVRIALQYLSRIRDEALSPSHELTRLEESLKAFNEKL